MSGSAGVSFSFSKTSRKQLTSSKDLDRFKNDKKDEDVDEDEPSSSKRILISGFDRKGAKDVVSESSSKDQKRDLVIPALENTIKFPWTGDDEDSKAKRALLEDAERFGKNGESETKPVSSIPLGSNKNEKLDLAAISTDDADYESIAVDDFAKALLRGMGWKDGQPIGRSGKKTMAPVITAPRPRGLGLGAEPKPPPEPSKEKHSKTEESDGAGSSKNRTLKRK